VYTILTQIDPYEKQWWILESDEELKEWLSVMGYSTWSQEIRDGYHIFKVDKQMDVQLNEVPFKGLST
jgi:hypothetical protein